MEKITAQIIGYIGAIKGVQSISAAKFEKDLQAAVVACAANQIAEVHIHSRGGSIDEGNAMISAIKKASATCTIATINNGLCASMAVPVFASATTRLAAKNSLFMIHGGSAESNDNTASGHRLVADMIEAYNHTIAVTLAEVMKNEDGSAMTADQIKETYLNDGQDHYLTAEQAVACGLATALADFSAENMPTNLKAMSTTEIEAHFGYNEVEAATNEIEGYELYLCGNLSNILINLMGLCDDIESSENEPLVNYAKQLSIQAAENFASLAVLLNISEKGDVQATATKLRQRITATLKPQTDVVAKADMIKVEAKATALAADLATAQATITTKETALATVQATLDTTAAALLELQKKIPGAPAAAVVGDKPDPVGTAEVSGWDKYKTTVDAEKQASVTK